MRTKRKAVIPGKTANLAVVLFCSLAILLGTPSGFAQDEPSAPHADFYVRLETTRGPLIIKVFYTVVPYTAGRFLSLVQKHFYDGLSFHRVEYWVVQGGDPTGTGTGSYIDPQTGKAQYLKLETSPRLRHVAPGMVAMARANHPDSASCQFYITKRSMPSLDGKYAVFGQVVRGVELLWEIQRGDKIVSAEIVGTDQSQSQAIETNQEFMPKQQMPAQQPPADPVIGDPGF